MLIKGGKTSFTDYRIRILDATTGAPYTGASSATSGPSFGYTRPGGTRQTITLSDLAAVDSAYSAGGIKHVANGWYRLDLPDGALATGVDSVLVEGSFTAYTVVTPEVQLVGYDPRTELTTAALANLDATVSSRSTVTTAQVNAEADTALADVGLTTTVTGRVDAAVSSRASASALTTLQTDVTTLLGRITSTLFSGITSLGNWLRLLARESGGDATALSELNTGGGTYVASTDSLEGSINSGGAGLTAAQVWAYATRTLTMSAAELESVANGTALAIHRGDTYSQAVTGLGSISGRTALWWTVKANPQSDADTASIIQVTEAGGLLYLNGAAYATPANGSITVTDAAAGNVTLALTAAVTAALVGGAVYDYDIQWKSASGAITTLAEGTLRIGADITRATS